MIVCLDTNAVVQALAQHHPFHPILDAWVAGHLTWAVSTPVLLEYEEVLTRLSGPPRWRKLARLMDLAELTSGNLLRVTPSFQFRVVTADPDDNIFTDCAITAGADSDPAPPTARPAPIPPPAPAPQKARPGPRRHLLQQLLPKLLPAQQLLHPSHQIGLRRFNPQVKMIAHQAIRVHRQPVFWHASVSVSTQRCRSASSAKMASRRSPRFTT